MGFFIFLNIFSNFTTQNKKQGKNPENILIFSGWTQLITDAVNGQWYLKNVYTAHIQEPRLMVVRVKYVQIHIHGDFFFLDCIIYDLLTVISLFITFYK